MRIASLVWLLVVAYAVCAPGQSGSASEDTSDIQRVLKAQDSSLDSFRIMAKQQLVGADAPVGIAVAVVEASATEQSPGGGARSLIAGAERIAVFAVEGAGNRVRRTIDIFSAPAETSSAELDPPTPQEIHLHLYGNYGFYQGSVKYIYELSRRTPPIKLQYGKLALISSSVRNGSLRYVASFIPSGGQVGIGSWTPRQAVIHIDPKDGGRDLQPGVQIEDVRISDLFYHAPGPLRAANGEMVQVSNQTPPGQPHPGSFITITGRSGKPQKYPAPATSKEIYRSMRPDRQDPGEIENDIGPYVFDQDRVWFATTFSDGEGTSGVGAIGRFDLAAHQYEMQYPLEIAPWSGSAILLDGTDLWIGLTRRTDGASVPGGLLRYNIRSGAVKKYSIADYIYTLDAIGGTLYCGTSNGLATVRGGLVTAFRFEPDANGKTVMVRGGTGTLLP